jgi:hypothetical protein
VIARALLLLLFVYLVVAGYLFLAPHDDRPAHAAAVVVLSGTRQRLPVGQRLVREGLFRARIVIHRCYHGGLRMVGAPQSPLRLPINVAKESLKLAYQEIFARSC